MRRLERRLESLEASFAAGRGADAGELGRLLFREAHGRISVVEMHVLSELCDVYRARPGVSPAEVWHDLTEAQRAMEYRWLDAVRDGARRLAQTNEDLAGGRREELRELVRGVGNYPFFEEVRDELL